VEAIKKWVERGNVGPLFYAPKARLSLKLFAYLGSSRLETRHASHLDKYRELLATLEEKLNSNEFDKTEILQSLENLFLGFFGAGLNRTWCTQTFLPITDETLGCEIMWEDMRNHVGRCKGEKIKSRLVG
jgi:hypothetical protein